MVHTGSLPSSRAGQVCRRSRRSTCVLCFLLSVIACALGAPSDACAQLRGDPTLEVTSLSTVSLNTPYALDASSSGKNTGDLRGTERGSGGLSSGMPRSSLRRENPPSRTVARAESVVSPDDRWIPGWRDVRGDVLNVVGAPFQLDRSDALQLAGAGGLVVGIMAGLDRPAARRFPESSGTNVAAIATPASAPGRWYDRVGPDRVALSTVGAFAVTGLALRNKQFTRTSFNLVEAMVLTKAATGFFKGLAGRTRPYANANPWDVNTAAFSSQHQLKSMPSGHTSRAFAIASVVAHDYPQWYVQIPAYTFAASAGVQRIRSGNHWLSDVVVGGALGYLIGRTVARDGRPKSEGRVTYDPIVGGNQLGLRIRF